MAGKGRTLVAAVVVGCATLVPLFGDPRATPLTHPLWARLLLRALDMNEAVRASTQASTVFATLAWRDSLSLSAAEHRRADGVSGERRGGLTVLRAGATEVGLVTFALAVVQPGDYALRARISGPETPPITAELTPLGGRGAAAATSLDPPPELGWAAGGALHLDPGAYEAQILLPPGCALSHLEIAPPCLNPIEPAGGWSARATTSAADVAVTALKALDAEHELPPAEAPIELPASAFAVEAPQEALEERAREPDAAAAGLRAGSAGLQALASFRVGEPGLYSLSVLGSAGGGQRVLLDGCRKAVVCAGSGERWRAVLSQSLAAGRHQLVLTLGPGASVRQVRLEAKRHGPEDYARTLARLGFEAGPPGPVSRAKALDAAAFVRERRRAQLAEACGDPVRIQEQPPALSVRLQQRPGDGPSVPSGPSQPLEPPIGPQLPPLPPPLAPQEPATPTLPLGD